MLPNPTNKRIPAFHLATAISSSLIYDGVLSDGALFIKPSPFTASITMRYSEFPIFVNYHSSQSYQKALRADPSYKPAAKCLAIVLTDIGTSLKLGGNTQEGTQKYYEALKIDPHYAPAFYNLDVVYSEMMQYDTALNCYEKVALERPLSTYHKYKDMSEMSASSITERMTRSIVWEHFKWIPGQDKAQCVHCGAHIGCASGQGPSSMHHHLSRCKEFPYANVGKRRRSASSQSIKIGSSFRQWKFDQDSN